MRRFLRAPIVALLLAAPAARADETTRFPAPASESVVLALHAATDVTAMRPLIRDFQDTEPHVAVAYTEYVTGELFERMQAACRGAGGVDLVLSSSVDQLVKLVNDGCAARLGLAETDPLPRWTRWRDELFGFTFEPAVIVYNADTVPPEDRRRSRAELIELLRSHPDRYAGRIGTYDVTTSGIGYLFSAYDTRNGAVFGRLLEALARADAVLSCCTTDLLARLADGRLAIGYNLLGSYAVAAIRRGARLHVVVPRDYTVVLSRAIFVPVSAPEPAAARAFVRYLLSERGQRVARATSFPFGLDGAAVAEAEGPALSPSSAAVRPIEIGPELLAIQDRAKRARLIGEWRGAMGTGGGPRQP
ncbi:MAG: ABC transporter substrate-binding protein [Methylobacterium frigidaeris]